MTPFVQYFMSFGEISDPCDYRSALAALPDDPAEICSVIQGLVINPAWIDHYGVRLEASRIDDELQARNVVDILDNVNRLGGGPLSRRRPPEQRTVGTCRTFSLLLCSVLRSKDRPARLRCGFAPYLDKHRYRSHWICEYWSEVEQYWVRVDPQLDEVQMESLGIGFDPCDIPIEDFLYAGEGWIMCRRGRADPQDFGLRDRGGLAFVKGSIVRDILALNKIETLPWDSGWGILDHDHMNQVDRSELGYVDRLARCSANSLVHLAHSFFADDERIRFPEGWNLSMAPTLAQLESESHRL